MEALAQRFVTRLVVGLGLIALAGCVSTSKFAAVEMPASSEPVCQLVATWSNKVTFVPDPTKNGQPAPGIAGRIYLFGASVGAPLVGDGGMVIDLYDDAPDGDKSQAKLLEQWRFDNATLRKLLRKDAVGSAYTIFLPWGTYSPKIHKVHLTVKYEPASGPPIFGPSAPLTLDHSEPKR